MRHYNFNPFTANKARIKTYLNELQVEIQSLTDYLEYHNPNYIILNKTIDNKIKDCYYDFNQLLHAQILWIAIDKTIENDSYKCFVIIRPNVLRLNRGILNTYGQHTKMYFGDYSTWTESGGSYKLYCDCSADEKTLVQDLINAVSPSFSLEEHSDMPVLIQNNKLDNDTYTLHPIKQGYVVFCNILEENEPQNELNINRNNILNYHLWPLVSANGYCVPDLTFQTTANNKTIWQWNYVDNATDKFGTNLLFTFNMPPNRYFWSNTTHGSTDFFYPKTIDFTGYTFDSYNIDSSKNIIPWISTYNDAFWIGQNNNILMHKKYTHIEGYEEEIFVDDGIKTGNTVLESYNNPYYTIDINHQIDFPNEGFITIRLW